MGDLYLQASGGATRQAEWKKCPLREKLQDTQCASLETVLCLKGENAQPRQLHGVWGLDGGAWTDVGFLRRAERWFCGEQGLFEEMHEAVCRADGVGS